MDGDGDDNPDDISILLENQSKHLQNNFHNAIKRQESSLFKLGYFSINIFLF
jgi:hypothetical protein